MVLDGEPERLEPFKAALMRGLWTPGLYHPAKKLNIHMPTVNTSPKTRTTPIQIAIVWRPQPRIDLASPSIFSNVDSSSSIAGHNSRNHGGYGSKPWIRWFSRTNAMMAVRSSSLRPSTGAMFPKSQW